MELGQISVFGNVLAFVVPMVLNGSLPGEQYTVVFGSQSLPQMTAVIDGMLPYLVDEQRQFVLSSGIDVKVALEIWRTS